MATLREDMIPHNEDKRRAEAVRALPTSPLFAERRAFEGFLSFEQRALRSLRRAQAIVNAYSALTPLKPTLYSIDTPLVDFQI